MMLFDVLQNLMMAQSSGSSNICIGCPGSSFTAIGAAFATQGYYVQAELIYWLTQTGLGLWAPLLYIFAAISGLIGVALGAPPKMYLWFFMGPGIYHWALTSTAEVYGVEWRVANIAQDQRQVWRLAEVGLANMPLLQRQGATITRCMQPDVPAAVANLFVDIDWLISGTVQQLVAMTGIYSMGGGVDTATLTGGSKGTSGTAGTSIPGSSFSLPFINFNFSFFSPGTAGTPAQAPTTIVTRNSSTKTQDRWYLLSNLKWQLLDTITSARFQNGNLRLMFADFMQSECGDKLSSVMDMRNFVAAAHSRSGRIPCSVFVGAQSEGCMARDKAIEEGSEEIYARVVHDLDMASVTSLENARKVWSDMGVGSFFCYADNGVAGSGDYCSNANATSMDRFQVFQGRDVENGLSGYYLTRNSVNCVMYLYTLIQGMRWEAAHIYHQLVAEAPAGMSESDVIYNLFYGWYLRDTDGNMLSTATTASAGGDTSSLKQWVMDLILVHILKNEMLVTRKLGDQRFLNQGSGSTSAQNANVFVASTGSRGKYGELYSWALMVPYVQGILLYFFAMAYPLACVLIVVPGWHRSLLTWMSFWVWIKLWDVGFAIVMVLERSIWSIMGSNSKIDVLAPYISSMQTWGKSIVSGCVMPDEERSCGGAIDSAKDCPVVPAIMDSAPSGLELGKAIAIFDRALTVGAAIDIDIANGYYMYIMAALYFAIPGITGQLVLGAKAGVSGMVGNLIQSAQSDGGRGSGSGFTSDLAKKAIGSGAQTWQTADAKQKRADNLVANALGAGNNAQAHSVAASVEGLGSQGLGYVAQAKRATMETAGQALSVATQAASKSVTWGSADLQSGTGVASGIGGITQTMLLNGRAVGRAAPPGGAGEPGGAAEPGGALEGGRVLATGTQALNYGANGYQAVAGYRIPQMNAETADYQARQANLGWGYTAQVNQGLTDISGQQMQHSINQGGHQMSQGGYGMQERRLGAQGEFRAQRAQFDAKMAMSEGSAGILGAMGIDTGYMAPGSLPTESTGQAMEGMLGDSAQTTANYASSGGAYWGVQKQAIDGLNASVGAKKIAEQYTTLTPGQMHAALGHWRNIVPDGALDTKAPEGINGKKLSETKMRDKDYSDPVSLAEIQQFGENGTNK